MTEQHQPIRTQDDDIDSEPILTGDDDEEDEEDSDAPDAPEESDDL